MKIHFILKTGGMLTWSVPESQLNEFSFVGMCRGTRCDGFFQAADVHIQYDAIASMCLEVEGVSAIVKGPTLQ